jgi:hypothetical protein
MISESRKSVKRKNCQIYENKGFFLFTLGAASRFVKSKRLRTRKNRPKTAFPELMGSLPEGGICAPAWLENAGD